MSFLPQFKKMKWYEKAVIGVCFVVAVCYGGTKPTGLFVHTDSYIINDGSSIVNSDTLKAKWKYTADIPPTAKIYIAIRPKGNIEAQWEDLAEFYVVEQEALVYVGDDAVNLFDYYFYTDFIPPPPVHTNGVYVFYVEHAKSPNVTNRFITIRSEVRRDNIKVMPHPREERK